MSTCRRGTSADADQGATKQAAARGRPRSASRELLEEAAYELFLEQGYAQTTAVQIATRAGVSRGTFFNYFATKADVFWVDLDTVIHALPDALKTTDPSLPGARAIREVLLTQAENFQADQVPWILTQFEAMGSPADVRGAAVERFSSLAWMLVQFILTRDAPQTSEMQARTLAHAALGAAYAALQEWARAGQRRAPLSTYVHESFRVFGETFGHESA